MAYFTRVNGDAQPVFALDIANGAANPNATSTGSGNTVQPQGPKLDFFNIQMANSITTTQFGPNGYLSNVLQAIQQTTTVAMYQVDGAWLSVALYPSGAIANTTVMTSVANAAGVAGVNQVSASRADGFKLAQS